MEENGHQLSGTIYNWPFFIPDTATPYNKDNQGLIPGLSLAKSQRTD